MNPIQFVSAIFGDLEHSNLKLLHASFSRHYLVKGNIGSLLVDAAIVFLEIRVIESGCS